jgi:hypothetical protein
MNENTNPKVSLSQTEQNRTEIDSAYLNLKIYKELDENPNQSVDLILNIQNQLKELSLIHQRKMFLIKEISAIRSR